MSQETRQSSPLVVPNSGRWIGNDGSWSTFLVQVGTSPQAFHVLPSISGQSIYVPVDEDCDPEHVNITDCGTKRGVDVFDSKPSLGFQRNASSTWKEVGLYRMGLGGNLGLTGDAYYGYDNVSFGFGSTEDAIQVKGSPVAAYAALDFWIGQLGLNPSSVFMNENNQPDSFLKMLKDGGKIPSLSFGYQAGSFDRLTRVAGSLVLGGYDRSRRSNSTLLVPLNPDPVVGVQSISIKSTNGTTKNALGDGIKATIDTNTPDMWLPTAACDAIASLLGLTYFQEADRYIVNETARSNLQSLQPTLSIVIGTSETAGATVTIEIPYGALDLQASYPIFGTPTNYFPLRRAANESQFTLGRAFLQEVYLSVDWERSEFNISQALFNSPPLPRDLVTIEPTDRSSSLNPQPNETGSKSMSSGAIAGVVIGAVGLLLALAGLWWWMHARRLKRKKNKQTESEQSHSLPADGKEVTQLPGTRTDLELEGQAVHGAYAPYEHYGYTEYKHSGQTTEVVEADSVSPIFELAEAVHELPSLDESTPRNS